MKALCKFGAALLAAVLLTLAAWYVRQMCALARNAISTARLYGVDSGLATTRKPPKED